MDTTRPKIIRVCSAHRGHQWIDPVIGTENTTPTVHGTVEVEFLRFSHMSSGCRRPAAWLAAFEFRNDPSKCQEFKTQFFLCMETTVYEPTRDICSLLIVYQQGWIQEFSLGAQWRALRASL